MLLHLLSEFFNYTDNDVYLVFVAVDIAAAVVVSAVAAVVVVNVSFCFATTTSLVTMIWTRTKFRHPDGKSSSWRTKNFRIFTFVELTGCMPAELGKFRLFKSILLKIDGSKEM